MSRKPPPQLKAAPAPSAAAGWRGKHAIDGRSGEGSATALAALKQIERSRKLSKADDEAAPADKPSSP